MPGINTSGKHNTEDYLIGRGKVFFATLDANGYPQAWRDVGNVPEINLTVESEIYDHFSSREGLRERDLRIVLQQDLDMSFVLEDINMNNLSVFFSGSTEEYTNPGIAGFVDAVIINDDEIVVNSWYDIVDGDHNRVFGLTATNALVIETTNGTPVALVLDTDYTLNSVNGMIFLNDTATVQTAISGSEGLTATVTADVAATTVDKVNVLSATELNVAIKVESINAEGGKVDIYEFHKVTIASDGDFALISDEAAQLPLTGGAEKNAAYANVADIYHPNTQS